MAADPFRESVLYTRAGTEAEQINPVLSLEGFKRPLVPDGASTFHTVGTEVLATPRNG